MADFADFSRPTTFQQDLLFSDFVSMLGNALPVALYSSVTVYLGCLDAVSPLAIAYKFTTLDGSAIDQGLLSANCSITGACWQLPVVGPVLTLTKVIAGSQIAKVYGSNTAVPGKRMLHDMLPARGFTGTIPNGTAANAFTRLTGSPVDGSAVYADLSGYNGNCQFIARVFTTGGSAQWDFLPEYLNYDGTVSRYVYQSLTGATTSAFVQAHPRAFVRWVVRNTTALTSAATVELDVIPSLAA